MIEKMGIKEIFKVSNTNFIPLVGNAPFNIAKVFQTNLLDVNEYGTELVSITAITAAFGCCPTIQNQPIFMCVDRPFLFLIRNQGFKRGKDIILLSKIEDI